MAKVIFVRYPDHNPEGPITSIGMGQLAELACSIRDAVNVGYLADVAIIHETQAHAMNTLDALAQELLKQGAKCEAVQWAHRSERLRIPEALVGFIYGISQRHALTVVLADAEGCQKLPTMLAEMHGFVVGQRYVGTAQAVMVDTAHHAIWLVG